MSLAQSGEKRGRYVSARERREAELARVKRRMVESQTSRQRMRDEAERKLREEQERILGAAAREHRSLVDVAAELRRKHGEETEEDIRKREEKYILERLTLDRQPLLGAQDAAKGRQFTKRLQRNWKPPRGLRARTEEQNQAVRDQYMIDVEGKDLPPPIKTFQMMRFPKPIIQALRAKNIKRPTPIQMQGLPVALSGRDMIGVAFTGSGKTLVFALPLLMLALEQELERPLRAGEGPVGLIICPSRELASQTRDVIKELATALAQGGYPDLRTMLVIGGVKLTDEMRIHQSQGTHMIVATPGRLVDQLDRRRAFTLDLSTYIGLDEADRLIDMGFEEGIRAIFGHFKKQRQTVLFSATMPDKIQEFALTSLNDPIVVNVGRAGAANLDVIQEVEYVKSEARLVYLLECLQKTAPPAVIFSSNQSDVDIIHEFLMIKGVNCVAVHGGKSQQDRSSAIKAFKEGAADVLVATDVASKGLDFPDIQHVLNYDFPKEIENYVHRIGRTGRCGKTGVATTFINRDCTDIQLLDLKHLLVEAKQKIPPVLQSLEDPNAGGAAGAGVIKCPFCGGPGHRITECPKLAKLQKSKSGGGSYDMVSNEM